MENILVGFITGLSLILAIGPQNLFVIEQGLKKNYIFLVCLICTLSDVLFIFLGIFLFSVFNSLSDKIDNLLNILLLVFIANFIWNKARDLYPEHNFKENVRKDTLLTVIIKTVVFTYCNPHVYSDTIFILGGFSKSLLYAEKLNFGLGASLASLIYFFSLGFGSSFFSIWLNNRNAWLYINLFIISYMSFFLFFLAYSLFK